MKKLAQGLMTFLAVIAVSVWTVSAFTVPQPLENFYVADYANVINSKDADAIRTVNKNLEARNGSQIVVATFDFLDGEAIDDVAYDLFNGWKIGSASDNNGVLLVLAIGEEDYYCLQGKGLEKTLPTSDIQAILDSTLEPEFAELLLTVEEQDALLQEQLRREGVDPEEDREVAEGFAL